MKKIEVGGIYETDTNSKIEFPFTDVIDSQNIIENLQKGYVNLSVTFSRETNEIQNLDWICPIDLLSYNSIGHYLKPTNVALERILISPANEIVAEGKPKTIRGKKTYTLPEEQTADRKERGVVMIVDALTDPMNASADNYSEGIKYVDIRRMYLNVNYAHDIYNALEAYPADLQVGIHYKISEFKIIRFFYIVKGMMSRESKTYIVETDDRVIEENVDNHRFINTVAFVEAGFTNVEPARFYLIPIAMIKFT
jgi:hypothetical protein